MNLYLVLLVSYAAVLMGLGLWIGRRVRNTGDFFVAGRRLGPGLLFSTMLAANIGAGSTVSAAALGYADGLSAWWWIGSAGFGSIVLAWWVGPRIRRLAAEHDFRTVGDFLEQRYGPSVRATVALLLLVGALALLAAQFIGGAVILSVVAGIDRWVGCVIAGLVVTVYFTAGGLLTSAWVNVVQLAVLLGGFIIVVPLALTGVGGWESVVAATSGLDGYWNPWQGGGSGWFYLAMLGPAFIVSPGLLQKVYGARDDRTVRIGVMANGVALLLFAAVPPLLGMMMRTLTSDLASPDLALPTLFVEALPPVVGAVGLAALFSAEVSSADAILFMLSTSNVPGHLSALRPARGDGCRCPPSRPPDRHHGRCPGHGSGRGRRDHRRGTGVLLHGDLGEPLHTGHRGPVSSTSRDSGGTHRDRRRCVDWRGDAGVDGRDRGGWTHAGHARVGRSRAGLRSGRRDSTTTGGGGD